MSVNKYPNTKPRLLTPVEARKEGKKVFDADTKFNYRGIVPVWTRDINGVVEMHFMAESFIEKVSQ